MKKQVFLGIDKNQERCCLLYSLVDFNFLKSHKNDLESNDFTHASTNWCGCDKIERTMEIKNFKKIVKWFELPQPLVFSGSDYDYGNSYSWEFSVKYIAEVK